MAKRIEFDVPDGLTIPEGVSRNGQFEVLATVQLKEDGRACLVALDGYRMPGYLDGDDDGKSYASAASEGLPGGY